MKNQRDGRDYVPFMLRSEAMHRKFCCPFALMAANQHLSHAQLAQKFRVARSTIQRWRALDLKPCGKCKSLSSDYS